MPVAGSVACKTSQRTAFSTDVELVFDGKYEPPMRITELDICKHRAIIRIDYPQPLTSKDGEAAACCRESNLIDLPCRGPNVKRTG